MITLLYSHLKPLTLSKIKKHHVFFLFLWNIGRGVWVLKTGKNKNRLVFFC